MTQQAPPGAEEALSYMKYQATKGTDSLVALIQRTAADWQRCVTGMSGGQACFAPDGEWAATDVLVHFLDATRLVNRQLERLLQGKDPATEPGGVVGNKPDDSRSLGELSDDVAAVFDEIVDLTRKLDGSPYLAETFAHPFFGQLNMLEWIAFQRIHAMDHIGQVDKIKEDPAYPA